ncbi:hypothetical protein [Microbispora sp. GKU 823]|uniref:hypothetical protein n=1 Tax=Microbispora sp. GKU 823 TaxID=1652100 RepID=UPI0026B7154A|nr:hypothetical protein [Microbispora sp. GKU 823]
MVHPGRTARAKRGRNQAVRGRLSPRSQPEFTITCTPSGSFSSARLSPFQLHSRTPSSPPRTRWKGSYQDRSSARQFPRGGGEERQFAA